MNCTLIKKENTLNWYKEYQSTRDLSKLPVKLIEEDIGKIKNRSVVFLGDCSGVSAVVLSYKRGGACVIVPVSEYSFASSEFELSLPKSNLVLETWNVRICVLSKLKEVSVLGEISESDMYIALSHYNAVFANEEFKFPTLIGESLSEIDKEITPILDKYLYEESQNLPESQFIVLPQDVPLSLKDFDLEESGEAPLEMPRRQRFTPYGIAATPPDDDADKAK